MSDEHKKEVEHIQALLAERRKIERWLQGLDSRRSVAPAHVLARVEADYRSKLAESQARLSNETGAVRSLLGELETVFAAQEQAVTAKADERAECELRAAVGEYGEKEWDKLKAKLDAAVAALEAERDGIRRELDTLRALLDDAAPVASAAEAGTAAPFAQDAATFTSTEGAPVESAEPVTPSRQSTAAATEAAAVTSNAPPTAAAPSGAGAARAAKPAIAAPPVDEPPTVDELAFLRKVLGGTTPPQSQNAPAPSTRESASGPRSATRANGTATRVSTGSSKLDAPELFTPPEAPMPISEDVARESGGFQRLSGQFGALGMNTPRTSEAVKSLKCNECGTQNYPTEWYCERCGGELAAF